MNIFVICQYLNIEFKPITFKLEQKVKNIKSILQVVFSILLYCDKEKTMKNLYYNMKILCKKSSTLYYTFWLVAMHYFLHKWLKIHFNVKNSFRFVLNILLQHTFTFWHSKQGNTHFSIYFPFMSSLKNLHKSFFLFSLKNIFQWGK